MPWGAKRVSKAGWICEPCQHRQHRRPAPGCVWQLITPAPPDPRCTAALPPVLFFPPGKQDIPSDSLSALSDIQLRAGTQCFSSRRLEDGRPFLFSSSSSSSLRAFWLQLQLTTSLSFSSMQASVQTLRTLFRPCLKAPARQRCGPAICPGWGGCPWKWQTQVQNKGSVANPDQSSTSNTCSDGYSIKFQMPCS